MLTTASLTTIASLRSRGSTLTSSTIAPRGVLLRVIEGALRLLVQAAQLREHREGRAHAPGRPAQLGVRVAAALGEEMPPED